MHSQAIAALAVCSSSLFLSSFILVISISASPLVDLQLYPWFSIQPPCDLGGNLISLRKNRPPFAFTCLLYFLKVKFWKPPLNSINIIALFPLCPRLLFLKNQPKWTSRVSASFSPNSLLLFGKKVAPKSADLKSFWTEMFLQSYFSACALTIRSSKKVALTSANLYSYLVCLRKLAPALSFTPCVLDQSTPMVAQLSANLRSYLLHLLALWEISFISSSIILTISVFLVTSNVNL